MLKRILLLLLVAVLLGGTALAFGYWDSLSDSSNGTIEIGQGVTLTVTDVVAEAPAGSYLVPTGVVVKENDVNSIDLTYNVKLDLAVVTALDLSVVESNVLIGGDATNKDLVNFAYDLASDTVNDSNVLVTVTVTLTAPATEEIYNLIKNQTITFDLTFSAE